MVTGRPPLRSQQTTTHRLLQKVEARQLRTRKRMEIPARSNIAGKPKRISAQISWSQLGTR